MSYIDLDSVGSTVTSDGLVFPIDCSEAPETASEAEEMMGVHIKDVDDFIFGLIPLIITHPHSCTTITAGYFTYIFFNLNHIITIFTF